MQGVLCIKIFETPEWEFFSKNSQYLSFSNIVSNSNTWLVVNDFISIFIKDTDHEESDEDQPVDGYSLINYCIKNSE